MPQTKDSVNCDIKPPKRILHFSDGVLEEYEDQEDTEIKDTNQVQSEKQLVLKNWPTVSVVFNSVVWIGSQTIRVCDYLGENLANFFGITSPKYEYEIQEYNRRVEEQNRRESLIKSEFEGWSQSAEVQKQIKFNDVKSVHDSKVADLGNYNIIDSSPSLSKV